MSSTDSETRCGSAALQRRKIGRAGGALALDDARRMGDGAEEILDALEDAVDLGAGLACHAQRHLPDLGLAGAAQRKLVMHQDDERRQHRNGSEEDKALRQREAGRGAAARKPAAGARERGPEERRKPRRGVQARAQPPQQRPGNITPPERFSRQIPNLRGVRRSNRRQVAQCDGDRAGEDGLREGRARPGESASALPAGTVALWIGVDAPPCSRFEEQSQRAPAIWVRVSLRPP